MLATAGGEVNIANQLQIALNERRQSLKGRDGVSQTVTQRVIQRGSKFILSTEKVVMGVSRFDHHGIAPLVLGGVYTLVKCVQGYTEEQLAALRVTVDIPEIIALWTSVEAREIRRPHPENQQQDYASLSREIKEMYQVVIVLLNTLLRYFNSKSRK